MFVSECDREASIMMTGRSTRGCCAMKEKLNLILILQGKY